MKRRQFLKLSAAALAPVGAAQPLGLDSRVEDWQSPEQVRVLLARFPGLQYVDPRPRGPMWRLSLGAEAVPARAPERALFNAANDDSQLRRAIDMAHQAGLKVFLSCLGWKQAGLNVPELMVTYIDGKPLASVPTPKYVYETRPPLCPNRPEVRRWKEALPAAILNAYEVEGCTLRYSNFNQPGFYPELFACWCEHCERAAGEWGYNFGEMRAALRKALDNLGLLDKTKLARLAQSDTGFIGFFCQLAGSSAPAQWFQFRADSIMRSIRAMRQKAEAAARLKGARFGCMTYYPTFALMVGQRYSDLPQAASYIIPQLLHWQILYMQNFLAMAEWFRGLIPGLTERDALFAIYRLFENDRYPMPESYAAMPIDPDKVDGPRSHHPALEPIIASELYRVKAWAGGVESFPILKESEWPKDVTQRLTALALNLGARAVWYQ